MSLIVTDKPFQDESGFGYYRRLASENLLTSWCELATLANIKKSRSALMNCPEHLTAELGLELPWANFAQIQEQRCRTWQDSRRTQADAICPACLKDDVYLRHHWEHSYVTACSIHRVRLIDKCPRCEELLSTKRERIDQCQCGQDLLECKTSPASAAELWLSAVITNDGTSSGGILPSFSDVNVVTFCKVVRILCIFSKPSETPARRRSLSTGSISEAIEVLKPLEAILQQWPRGFEAHVSKRIAAGNQSARTLNTLLGSWYLELKKLCSNNELQIFLAPILRISALEFDGTIGLNSLADIPKDGRSFIRLPEAAKKIGISADRLRKAVKEDQCAYRTHRLGTKGVLYEIPQSEIERLCKRRREWISEDVAAQETTLPVSVLRMMGESGVLSINPRWRNDIHKNGPIEVKSLEVLYERLRVNCVSTNASHSDCIFFRQLNSKNMGDKRAIYAAMLAVSEGQLKPVACGKTLGDVSFLKTDVAAYFGRPLLESGLSLQQLADASGWKWETISHWIELGLLESTVIKLRGQQCRVISPQQIVKFCQAYIPLSDLASAMGTKSSALAKKLRNVEIFGAKPLADGKKRGGLIRIAELGALALS